MTVEVGTVDPADYVWSPARSHEDIVEVTQGDGDGRGQ